MLNLFNVLTIFAADSIATNVGDYEVGNIDVGYKLPGFGQILTFIVRIFFVVAGLVALLYLLLGALAWITSGGNKEGVEKAREKIQAALVGVILIFAVLAIVGVLENIVGIHLGITQPIEFPSLVTT